MARGPADFEEFVREASPSLLRTAWLICGQADTARDLVQAALVKTYLAWPRVRRPEALAYARRTLVNLHTDTWRRTRHERLVESVPEGAVPERGGHDRATRVVEDRAQIVQLLATLPPQQRAVVVLRYYADLPEAEVARMLGVSVGSVKSAASRGLARLRVAAAPGGAPSDPPAGEPAEATVTELDTSRRRQA